MYVVAQGAEGVRDSRLVIGVDLATGAVREYDVGLSALKSVAATDRYLFVTSVINGVSNIIRLDKQSADATTTTFEGDFLTGIVSCGQRLAIFRQPGFDFSLDAELLIMDEEMEVLDTILLEGLGNASSMTPITDDTLCFGAFVSDTNSSTQYRNTLNLYSLTTGELRTIAESDYQYGFAALAGEHLVVLQSEVNVSEGNRILLLNPSNGEIISQIATDYMPQYLLAKEGLLSIAGFDLTLGDYRLQRYRVDNASLGLIAETHLDSVGFPRDDYGISGLYAHAD
jgi:hypothetical protein